MVETVEVKKATFEHRRTLGEDETDNMKVTMVVETESKPGDKHIATQETYTEEVLCSFLLQLSTFYSFLSENSWILQICVDNLVYNTSYQVITLHID